MPASVAIVGSGPSGFYAAAALVGSDLDCRVDVIEVLPTPFGLVRGGVAPDHQSTKGVMRAYTRTALDPGVAFFGNVALGRDLSLAELRQLYDAVVLAIGAPLDRRLGVPGDDKAGAYGAAAFVGWYNGHPDFRDLDPKLNTESVAVVGNGNVALDVARVLVKTPAEMAASDLPDYAAQAIHQAPIADVYLIGRRGPLEAKFTNKELAEFGTLEDAAPVVDAVDLPGAVPEDLPDRERRLKEKNLASLRGFAGASARGKRKRVYFLFHARPVEVLGGAQVAGVRLERTEVVEGRAVGTGSFFEIPCGLVIAAIGYRMPGLEGLEVDARSGVLANRDGRIAAGLYAVGWAKRGPTGVIGTNKADGDRLVEQLREDLRGDGKVGRAGLERLLRERRVRWVSFADWQRIEAAESAAAAAGAPRRKLCRVADLLAVLDPSPATGGRETAAEEPGRSKAGSAQKKADCP